MKSLGKLNRAVLDAKGQVVELVALHPRTLTSLVVVGLVGFAATAFGIAPMAPDAADLPRSLVSEAVQSHGVADQLEALSELELTLYRSEVSRPSDTADSLLRRLNVNDPAAARFLRTDPVARKLLEGRAGKMVRVRGSSAGELGELVARFAAPPGERSNTHFTRLSVLQEDGRFRATAEVVPLVPQQRLGSGTIRTSLFAATDGAGLSDALASQLAEVFSADIDFRRELRKGDTFSVVYETMTADGEPVTWNAAGAKVIAAEFVNRGKKFSAVWFRDSRGKGAYYDFDGKSRTSAYLSSPLEFSRQTSGFAMRMHPILNQWRQHKGIDLAAPQGTPVRSVGDGVVEFAGRQNGYGNVIQIDHGKERSTLYAHLSRVDVAVGQRVEQGQYIGAVGATGWATGPHLHFEFKVGGVHEDPTAIAQGSEATTVPAESRQQFEQWADGVRVPLEAAQTLVQGLFQAE